MEQAHYYAAVLNYLAYKAVQLGRPFTHHQLARPVYAILIAGLSWNEVPEDLREKVIQKARNIAQGVVRREFSNQRQALLGLFKNNEEFRELIRLLDEYVDKERLNAALDMVSGTSKI